MRALGVSHNYKIKYARSLCEGALGSAKVLVVLTIMFLQMKLDHYDLGQQGYVFRAVCVFVFQQDYQNITEWIFRKLGKEESFIVWCRHGFKKQTNTNTDHKHKIDCVPLYQTLSRF